MKIYVNFANANSIVKGLAKNVGTVQTVDAKNVMQNKNSFWVLYGRHTEPTFLEDAGDGQKAQRDNALNHVQKWRTCIDIGSNIGQWTRPLAEKFRSVVCFEPNPNFVECFRRNIDEKNVILWQYALSNKVHSASQDFNSTQLKNAPGDIKCRTLDSFGLTEVDLVKIDVDGYEVPLLQGARDTLKNNNPVICIEMKRKKRTKITQNADAILQELGYRHKNVVRSDEIWLKS